MMEKDPSLRIQSAAEVAERLAPWASDNSPLDAAQIERSRWMPAPLPRPAGSEDTDPATEMALTELSGFSESSHGSSTEFGGKAPVPTAPAALSIVGQYKKVPRLAATDPTYPVTTVMFVGVIALILGTVIGFLAGRFM